MPGHCSTRQQRSIHCLSGVQRIRIILYADELSEIVKIYGATFTRFGLKISTDKTETMGFNVEEEIKKLKNFRVFKYLGHMIVNTDVDPSHYLNFRISSAFQKWNELKHILTDRRISMSTRSKNFAVASCTAYKLGNCQDKN